MSLEATASSPGEGQTFVEFYSLREDPFRSLDPRYIFLSTNHRKALAGLHYGIERGDSMQLLLAEAGLGKTVLLRHLQGRLQASARVSWFSAASFKESELPIPAGGTRKKGQPDQSQEMNGARTKAPPAERSRQIVLIDDAQDLGDMQLASLIVLAKAELSSAYNIHIILAGRPRLLEKLRKLNWANARDIRITPMSAAETKEYIVHRLRMAGSQSTVFTPAACAMIAQQSGGIPDSINTISGRALSAGAKRLLRQIDASAIERNGANESRRLAMTLRDANALAFVALPKRHSLAWLGLALVLVLFVAVAAGFWIKTRAPFHSSANARNQANFAEKAKADFFRTSGSLVETPPPHPFSGTPDNAARMRSSSAASPQNQPTAPNATSRHQAIARPPDNSAELAQPSHFSIQALSSATSNTGAPSYPPSVPARSIVPPTASSEGAIGLTHEEPHAYAPLSSPALAPDAHRAQIDTEVGDDYMSMRKYNRAIEFYQDAAALAPNDDRIKKKLAEARIGALTR